jgi:hypothetical protein
MLVRKGVCWRGRKKSDRTNLKDAANLKVRTGPDSPTVSQDRSRFVLHNIYLIPDCKSKFNTFEGKLQSFSG